MRGRGKRKRGRDRRSRKGGSKQGRKGEREGALKSHLFQISVSHAKKVRELDAVTLEEREEVSQLQSEEKKIQITIPYTLPTRLGV